MELPSPELRTIFFIYEYTSATSRRVLTLRSIHDKINIRRTELGPKRELLRLGIERLATKI